MQKVEAILKEHDLRVTPTRVKILKTFMLQHNALSHADLETQFKSEFDRVTIYRTLTSFLEYGLLHRVPDDSGVAKYALCKHDGTAHNHDDDHVHFKCKKCEKIECLHDLEIPRLHLPKKYIMEDANLLIEGICADCNV